MRDFIEDIKNGLVNISLEDILKYNIDENDIYKVMLFNNKDIRNLLPNSILDFLIDSTKVCEDNLNTYYSKMSELFNLRNSTKLTLNLGYEKSIKRYLKKIKNHEN